MSLYKTTYPSPIGEIILVADGTNLLGLWFAGCENFSQIAQDHAIISGCNSILSQAKNWLTAYFSQENPDPNQISFVLQGSRFQRTVWQALCRIPYGSTKSYGAIANEIAISFGISKMSSQAVGGAISRNPISIIVPCHRVISATGKLTGYAGGLNRKEFLLQLETCASSTVENSSNKSPITM